MIYLYTVLYYVKQAIVCVTLVTHEWNLGGIWAKFYFLNILKENICSIPLFATAYTSKLKNVKNCAQRCM